MTISEFRLLKNMSQQTTVISAYGVALGTRQRDDFNIILYQIDGFYIEAYIHQYSNKIVGISSFVDTDELEPYLHKIDISPLLQVS